MPRSTALSMSAGLGARGRPGAFVRTSMIPFCRRVEEGKKVLPAMAANGLKRGDNGLEVYVMCERESRPSMLMSAIPARPTFRRRSLCLSKSTQSLPR